MEAWQQEKDDYNKVSAGMTDTVHLSSMLDGWHTLCGLLLWTDNNHGQVYCKNCQRVLAQRLAKRRKFVKVPNHKYTNYTGGDNS